MGNKLSLGIGLMVILLVGGVVWFQMSTSSPAPTSNTMPVPGETVDEMIVEDDETTNAEGSTTKSFTLAQVQTHNSATSCWTIVDNGVYDITAWIAQHPGGPDAILKLCGADGTELFRNQHKSNPKQENVLATMKIGTLAE